MRLQSGELHGENCLPVWGMFQSHLIENTGVSTAVGKEYTGITVILVSLTSLLQLLDIYKQTIQSCNANEVEQLYNRGRDYISTNQYSLFYILFFQLKCKTMKD